MMFTQIGAAIKMACFRSEIQEEQNMAGDPRLY